MYPDLKTIRTLEIDTLRKIMQIGSFSRLGQIQTSAAGAQSAINEFRGGVNVHLGFTLEIRLRGDRRGKPVPRRIDLGALVEAASDNVSVNNASYSLLIARYANPATSPIVRKVHFDYEPIERRNAQEPKPSAHMQLCGKFSPHHLAAGYTEVRLRSLYPAWEKPRIPLPPTSIALMLNWLLLEFQTDPASQAILSDPTWRNCVIRAEQAILKPYFVAGARFLANASSAKQRFLQSHLYELGVDA